MSTVGLSDSRKCSYCSQTEVQLNQRFKKCSACKDAYYCSIEHQRADWKIHKVACQSIERISKGMQGLRMDRAVQKEEKKTNAKMSGADRENHLGQINEKFEESLKTNKWKTFLEGLNIEERVSITKVMIPVSFTNQDVQFILSRCLGIEMLNMRCCNNLTEIAFQGVALQNALQKIDLMGSKINDKTLEALLLISPKVRDLNLWGCKNTLGNAFRNIKTLDSLQSINLS